MTQNFKIRADLELDNTTQNQNKKTFIRFFQVASSTFIVGDDEEVKKTRLGGRESLSLTGDLTPTFSISLFKDADLHELINAQNLKLGETIFFTIIWENSENVQVNFFAQECRVVDGSVEVSIIKDTCTAGVVDVEK